MNGWSFLVNGDWIWIDFNSSYDNGHDIPFGLAIRVGADCNDYSANYIATC